MSTEIVQVFNISLPEDRTVTEDVKVQHKGNSVPNVRQTSLAPAVQGLISLFYLY